MLGFMGQSGLLTSKDCRNCQDLAQAAIANGAINRTTQTANMIRKVRLGHLTKYILDRQCRN